MHKGLKKIDGYPDFAIQVTLRLPRNMSNFQYGQSTQRESAPARVEPDMENGFESGSCALARAFYDTHGVEASQINDRSELGRFFASKQNELLQDEALMAACTKNGLEDPRRHWSQILFSLARHGKVLKVSSGGSWIEWNSQPTSVPGPSQQVLQIAQVLANDHELLLYIRERLAEKYEKSAYKEFAQDRDEIAED